MSNSGVPTHVAIVMDGNGRWAKQRLMPRILGHRAGVQAVRRAIDFCITHQIQILSLFALSVENFVSRPLAEVQFLVQVLADSMEKYVTELHEKNIRIRLIGDFSVFDSLIQEKLRHAQLLTKNNTGLILLVALHYSGRWDIVQAAKQFAQHAIENNEDVNAATEKDFAQFLCAQDLPEPDLFIRTSGEQRMSNFFLWQSAYTELYFTDVYWPDFDDTAFSAAIATFQKRERRFGLTGEQLVARK